MNNMERRNIYDMLEDEQPLIVKPQLAVLIGLNEAIVLQQIKYWITKSQHKHDGRLWVYNTLEQWHEQFPFWSVDTIRRTLTSLTEQNLIVTGNYNKEKRDRTKWYALNLPNASVQNAQMEDSNLHTALPETTTKSINTTSNSEDLDDEVRLVYQRYLIRHKIDASLWSRSNQESRVQFLDAASKRYVLTDVRRDTIKRRLKDAGYGMVVAAIDSLAKSEWHMGDNPRGKKYNDLIDNILKSYEQVEKLANDDHSR